MTVCRGCWVFCVRWSTYVEQGAGGAKFFSRWWYHAAFLASPLSGWSSASRCSCLRSVEVEIAAASYSSISLYHHVSSCCHWPGMKDLFRNSIPFKCYHDYWVWAKVCQLAVTGSRSTQYSCLNSQFLHPFLFSRVCAGCFFTCASRDASTRLGRRTGCIGRWLTLIGCMVSRQFILENIIGSINTKKMPQLPWIFWSLH